MMIDTIQNFPNEDWNDSKKFRYGNDFIQITSDEYWYELKNNDMIYSGNHKTRELKWYESTNCDS